MGKPKKRPGRGQVPKDRWTAEDFKDPPDQSAWSDTKKAKFKQLREQWLAETVVGEDHAAADGGSGDSNAQIQLRPDDPVVQMPLRPASGNPGASSSSASNAGNTTSDQTNVASTNAAPATTASSAVNSASATATTWHSITRLESDPQQEPLPAGKKITGDLGTSEINTYLAQAQQDLGQPSSTSNVTRFCTNHLSLRIHSSPQVPTEYVNVYPVTITHEQKPRSLKDAPQNPAQAGGNDLNYPKVSAKKRRRLFELLLTALASENPVNNSRRASNYKTQIAAVQHELTARVGSQIVQAPFSIEIQYFESSRTGPSNDPWIYRLAISQPKHSEVGRLQRTLAATLRPGEAAFAPAQIDAMKFEVLNLFNMLITQAPNEACIATTENSANGMATAAASKFYPYQPGPQGLTGNETQDLHNGLIAIFGYYRSARLLNSTPPLQLNINTATSAFYSWEDLQTVMDASVRFESKSTAANYADVGLSQWLQLENFVRGLQVRARYGTVNKVYTVTGLAMTEADIVWDPRTQAKVARPRAWPWRGQRAPIARNVSFHKDQLDAQGVPVRDNHGIIRKLQPAIPILEHYRTNLHVGGLQLNDFVVRTGGGERVLYFPARLLTVLPGQNYKGQIAIKAGAKSPSINRRDILGPGKRTFGFDAVQAVTTRQRFGLEIGNQGHLLETNGERLNTPYLKYGSNKQISLSSKWNLRGYRSFKPAQVAPSTGQTRSDVWSFIEFTTQRGDYERNWNSARIDEFLRQFGTSLRNFGVSMADEVDSTDGYRNHKIDVRGTDPWSIFKEALSDYPHVKLWVVLLPQPNTEWYSQIKIIGDLTFGISTVCHVKKFKKDNQLAQLCSNICLKANLKLSRSSVNHSLATPSTPLGAGTMVVGIDVTHAPGGSRKHSPSIAAVVASVDEHYNQWPASIKLNARAEDDPQDALEEVQELRQMMIERLACYKRRNGQYPQRIIIYRDGLSEGQFEMAKTKEFGRIKAAIDASYTDDGLSVPQVMLICAVKRHQTRFLPASAHPTGATDRHDGPYQTDYNPNVGTAFYDTVTYGDHQDFFLVSQNAMRGATVRPTHYVVLVNTFPNKSIQDVAKITLDLCFVFGRATCSVGLVTPAYYADLACGRAAKYLAPHTRVDPDDRQRPFDYARAPQIQLVPNDNSRTDRFSESMFYL